VEGQKGGASKWMNGIKTIKRKMLWVARKDLAQAQRQSSNIHLGMLVQTFKRIEIAKTNSNDEAMN
jgi:hypothetical protein